MIDYLMAVLGPKHCGWCRDKPHNLIERWAGGFKRTIPRRVVWWVYMRAGLGLWRLGERHHWKYHEKRT